jgi:uncharacterized membrane protein
MRDDWKQGIRLCKQDITAATQVLLKCYSSATKGSNQIMECNIANVGSIQKILGCLLQQARARCQTTKHTLKVAHQVLHNMGLIITP